jgi:hypothetical protein
VKLVAYYRLGLRLASADFQSQALRIPTKGWNSIIRTVLREVANEVMSGTPLLQLLAPEGRVRFKQVLSETLAQQIRSLGLIVNPQTGVSVQGLRLTEAAWHAMMDRFAAEDLGQAALTRVRPILEELNQHHSEVAWEALLLEWAAAVAQRGNLPQAVIAPANGLGRSRYVEGALPTALQVVQHDIVTPTIEHRSEPGAIRHGQDGG